MKATFLSFLCAALPLCAAPPEQNTGKVLLLDNEQLLEGDITQQGNRYSIRTPAGETVIPASRALALVQTRAEAYRELRKHANLRDPDERMRLARWCLHFGLHEEALAETGAILRSIPDHREALNLDRGLRVAAKEVTPPPVVAPTTKMPTTVIDVSPIEFNRESFPLFATKVNTILSNACASCHGNGKGGGFQLMLSSGPGDRRAINANLMTALRFVDFRQPAESLLLKNATLAHGNQTSPPLKAQHQQAMESLRTWIEQAVDIEGAPPRIEVVPTKAEVRPPPTKVADRSTSPVFGETSKSKPLPETKTEPTDPFDPDIFNGTVPPPKK